MIETSTYVVCSIDLSCLYVNKSCNILLKRIYRGTNPLTSLLWPHFLRILWTLSNLSSSIDLDSVIQLLSHRNLREVYRWRYSPNRYQMSIIDVCARLSAHNATGEFHCSMLKKQVSYAFGLWYVYQPFRLGAVFEIEQSVVCEWVLMIIVKERGYCQVRRQPREWSDVIL